MVYIMGWNITMFFSNLMLLLILSKVHSFTITLPSTSVVKGENYRMTCSYTGTIPGSVGFMKHDVRVCQNLNPGGSCSESKTPGYHCGCINSRHLYLNITQVAQTDDAVWKCTNNFGTGSANSLRLEVYYGPESVIMTPATIGAVIEGGAMTRVTCSADCKPTCDITWSFSGSVITTNNGVLQLTNMTRTQHGGYTCIIHNKHIPALDKTQIITVIVHYGPDPIQFKPDITSITVTEGDNPVITCSTDCRPSCDIKWKSGNSEISSDGKLSLPSINRTQHGVYVCIVTNLQIPNSEKRKTLTVNVNYPPRIISLTSSAVNNIIDDKSSVTFTCSSDSRPDSTITWTTSNQTNIGSGTQYTIPVASCQHTDNYTCTANNNIGPPVFKTIPEYVRCSPRLRDGLESEVTDRIGQTVRLEVDVLAYPKPTFIWRYNSTGEELNGATIEMKSENNYVSMIKIELELSSFGVYSVLVNNDVGVSVFVIRVIDGGSTTTPSSVTECTTQITWIVVVCILGLIVASCFGVFGVLLYLRRFNLHCNPTKKNSDTAAVTYDVVGARDVNNYDGLNMAESTDNPTSPVYSNQTTNPDHPPASSRDSINQTSGSGGSNPVNTYEHLATVYTNENSYETL